MAPKIITLLILLALPTAEAGTTSDWYQPTLGTTWHWQLQGPLNTDYQVEVYDIDLFDTSAAQVQTLHRQGHKVICYFSAGSNEDWRPDASTLPQRAIGLPLDGWPGEAWLDIRDKRVWRTMQNRLRLAAEKGCDGVEPDNVDVYQNRSGFLINKAEQLRYNRFLARSAHLLNLSIGLKNSVDLIPELVNSFDFAVNEECITYQECSKLAPFIEQNKAIFHAEYRLHDTLCEYADTQQFSTLYVPTELDDRFRKSCL